jgi:molybdate transport system substrate-binding protein
MRGVAEGLAVAAVLLGVPAWAAEPLRIAAAADLQPVLPALLADFEGATGVHAEASFASSATLTTQIENGAPFDLFLAADTSFPQRLVGDGLTVEGSPVEYARGTLVLWARRDGALLKGGGKLRLEALREKPVARVAIANPERAPYGRAAKAALESLGLMEAVGPKLVTADNIAQAAQFALTGNADVGLISLTSALTPAMREAGEFVEVPRGAYPPIVQGAVLLKRSGEQGEAERFLDWLRSPKVREELKAKGLGGS